jgi:hypothetical protein
MDFFNSPLISIKTSGHPLNAAYTNTQDKKNKARPVYHFEDVDNEPISNKIPKKRLRDADREPRLRSLEARRIEKPKVESQAA